MIKKLVSKYKTAVTTTISVLYVIAFISICAGYGIYMTNKFCKSVEHGIDDIKMHTNSFGSSVSDSTIRYVSDSTWNNLKILEKYQKRCR